MKIHICLRQESHIANRTGSLLVNNSLYSTVKYAGAIEKKYVRERQANLGHNKVYTNH